MEWLVMVIQTIIQEIVLFYLRQWVAYYEIINPIGTIEQMGLNNSL